MVDDDLILVDAVLIDAFATCLLKPNICMVCSDPATIRSANIAICKFSDFTFLKFIDFLTFVFVVDCFSIILVYYF
ncbi:hypothetical protein D6827_02125 [Candidatus Parcubacteria bacterium]|nr:MAG: hypothetical protein D6827_02125 [Candidatus Parcubacteria bacterium]